MPRRIEKDLETRVVKLLLKNKTLPSHKKLSANEIAKECDIARSTVNFIRNTRLKGEDVLSARPLAGKEHLFLKMYNEGRKPSYIARELDTTSTTIVKKIKQLKMEIENGN